MDTSQRYRHFAEVEARGNSHGQTLDWFVDGLRA